MTTTAPGILHNTIDVSLTAIIRGLAAVVRTVPAPLGEGICNKLIDLFFMVQPRWHTVALRNLSLVFPEKNLEERERIAHASRRALARNIFYFFRAKQMSAEEICAAASETNCQQIFRDARAASGGVGILVPTMHFGPFELTAHAYSLHFGKLAILARGFGLDRLDAWWNTQRGQFGNRVFSRAGGYREMLEGLNSGEDVAALCDQNVKANHAAFASFFGIQAATTKALPIAALRTGAPVVFLIVVPDGAERYQIFARRLPNPAELPGNSDERIVAWLEALHRTMEEVIRQYPEQWFWIHRRFKTRPAGEPENLY